MSADVLPRREPRSLRKSAPTLGYLAGAAVFALAAAAPWLAPEALLSGAIVILLNAYLAQAWNLAAGYAGQFSLGHSLFLAIGGYSSTILLTQYGISPWLGALVGALLAALVGAALSAVSFRFKVTGVFFAVVTLSAAEVGRGLFENWDFVGGTSGVVMILSDDPANMMFLSRVPYYELILVMVGALAIGTRWLSVSPFGQRLLAVREDEAAAEAIGVRTFSCKVWVIALSAACTALAGTFYAQFLLFIVPDSLFSFEHMLTMMLGAMVGGAGTVLGPILGASIFGLLSEAFRSLPIASSREAASLFKVFYGLVLMVVVLRLPGGVMSLLGRRRDRRAK